MGFSETAGAELAAFLLAADCAGCGAPGVLLCEDCTAALAADPVALRTPGGLTVHAALAYQGVAARCIRRLKGEGETLLSRPLGRALGEAVAAALREHPVAGIVPVPTSRRAFRARGYRVPELLLRRAGVAPWRVLAAGRRAADQRGLGVAERAANVRGSVRARRRAEGARVLVMDDVVTTGATLDEAARVLESAGFEVVAAVALAATPRRSALSAGSWPTHRRHGANDP